MQRSWGLKKCACWRQGKSTPGPISALTLITHNRGLEVDTGWGLRVRGVLGGKQGSAQSCARWVDVSVPRMSHSLGMSGTRCVCHE